MNKALYINILTDSNRSEFYICSSFNIPGEHIEEEALTLNTLAQDGRRSTFLTNIDHHTSSTDKKWRVVYSEAVGYGIAAQVRKQEICTYTRMQIERLIRKANPNWIDLKNQTISACSTNYYHPGEKFSPNTPNRTSFR